MGFDTRESLEIELKAAKEMGDAEYIQQVRESLVAWDLDKRFNLVWPSELYNPRLANYLECDGVFYRFGKWATDNGFADSIDEGIDDLSGQRIGRNGESRWDMIDDYEIDGTEATIGGVIVAGTSCYAEVWFDDSATAYIEL